MPIIKSAIKRVKQSAKRRARNVATKRDIKSAVKTFFAKPTAAALSAAHSELDTAAKKKLLKKTTVARRKSQLAKAAKDAGVKLATAKKIAAKPVAKKAVAAKKTTAKPAIAKKSPAKKPTVKKS